MNNKSDLKKRILNVLYVSLFVGFLMILLYASKTSPTKFLSLCSVAMLIASSSFGAGGLLGFLFGIPIALQQPMTNSSEKKRPVTDSQSVGKPSYRGNTNLEEISNWLTKILVGIGLTQIPAILKFVHKYSELASPGLGKEPSSKVCAISILIYFSICGFIASYMWTKLNLVQMFNEADNPRITRVTRQKISKLLKDCVDKLYDLQPIKREHICELKFDEEEDDEDHWEVLKQIGSQIVAMYRPYRDGIVLAFGHDFLLDNVEEEAEESKEELGKEVRELKRKAIKAIFDKILHHDNNKKRVIVSTGHSEVFTISSLESSHNLNDFKGILESLEYTIEEIEKPINDSKLKKGDILIVGNAKGDFKYDEVQAVKKFVSRGGSLFVVGVEPCCLSLNCNHSNSVNKNIWTYPMNKLVEPYKMRFSENRVNLSESGLKNKPMLCNDM